MNDAVNHPAHYTQGDVECIDAIDSALGLFGAISYANGCAIKYLWRWTHKGGVEDLKKASWYIEHMISKIEEMDDELSPKTGGTDD